ncbi:MULTISPECIES: hypothetical protein [Nonomuraea]|uniref:Uncharacterized protein n=1 Tax=Nonomuraea mangrovi TaxID=2316207 RepID=A0ABW4SZT1_9ACTN
MRLRYVPGFPSPARKVRDRSLPIGHRLSALHECARRFSPYGFRATWHHLTVSARIPKRLEHDPESLERALDELEAARRLWLLHMETVALRRRESKSRGHRIPRGADEAYPPGWSGLLHCPDLDVYPRDGLVAVIARLVAAYAVGATDRRACLACETPRPATEVCPRCGVAPRGYARSPSPEERERMDDRWRQVWGRTWATPYGFTRRERQALPNVIALASE